MLKLVITSLILFASTLHALSPDNKLAQDIQDRLNSGPKNYRHITVEVTDGIVILHGNVRTEADKEKIEKAVQKIDGVSKIQSQIKVYERKSDKGPTTSFPQDSYSTKEDRELNELIRSEIGSYWFWDKYEGLGLNTSNGVVTLEGMIDNADDAQELLEAIKGVEGVKSVRSNLEVQIKD